MKENLLLKTALKWGAIFSGVTIIMSILDFQSETPTESGSLSFIVLMLLLAGTIVMALREFRMNNGVMSLGQGFGIGVLAVSLGSIVSSIFSFLYLKYYYLVSVNPNFLLDLREKAIIDLEKQMEANPAATEESFEMGVKAIEGMISLTGIFWTQLIMWLIIGAIASIIIAAIMKRSGPSSGASIEDIQGIDFE